MIARQSDITGTTRITNPSTHPDCFILRRAHQVGHVELEVAWELLRQLVDAVEPLQKHGTPLVGVLRADGVTAPVGELVAKVEPLALQQRLEPLWSGEETGQRGTGHGVSLEPLWSGEETGQHEMGHGVSLEGDTESD